MKNEKSIFISYTHKDRDVAERLSRILIGYGFSVWWDHALLGGDNFRDQIAQKIYESKVVLVLFSQHSIGSGWVLDEAGRADQANKLVPIRIYNVDVPLGFGHLHRCDLIDWVDDDKSSSIDSILQTVERFTEQERSEIFVEPVVTENSSSKRMLYKQRDRFSVPWMPDKGLLRVISALSLIYFIALIVALIMAKPGEALSEWVRLLHVYSGMITLGGGIFLSVAFRLGDRAPGPIERAAIADVARSLYGGWRIAAIAQLFTGLILIAINGTGFPGWLVQSVILYLFALHLWLIGFGHALRAAKYDTLHLVGEHIDEYRRLRDHRLLSATIVTAWVLITMIYREDADLASLLVKLFDFIMNPFQSFKGTQP